MTTARSILLIGDYGMLPPPPPNSPTILHLPKHAHMITVSTVKQKRSVGEGGRDGKAREREKEEDTERKERH